MTKEERLILETVNLALEAHDRPERFAPHRFFPMRRCFFCDLPHARMVRIWTGRAFRRLDIFQERPQRDGWGNTKTIGTYRGTGWLPQLAQDAVDTVTDPPDVPL